MTQIEVEAFVPAPPEAVYDLLIQHERMPEWLPVREVVLRRPGSPDPNGPGAVRTVRGRGLVVDERVTAAVRPSRITYVLVEGAPVRNHRGALRLEPEASGTRVRWSIRFRPVVPLTGGLLAWVLRRDIARGLGALARRFAPPADPDAAAR